jgi:hypothetical protein
MTDQLDRSIEIPKKRMPWLKYFFQFAIPAFLISIKASSQKTQGRIRVNRVVADTAKVPIANQLITMGTAVPKQTCIKPLMGDTMITTIKKTVIDKTVKTDTVPLPEVIVTTVKNDIWIGKVSNDQVTGKETNTINGKVVDEKDNPIPYASVTIKGTRTGIATNAKGSFSIKFPAGWENITLVVSTVGYEPTEVKVDKKNLSDSIIIRVRTFVAGMVVGELTICRKPQIKKELKNIPLMPAVIDDKQIADFKIFPNPVESGASLNIEINKAEEGYYQIQLLNQSGQSVHQQEIWIDAEARLLSIDLPPLAAGNYFVILANRKSGKRSTEKIIIQ